MSSSSSSSAPSSSRGYAHLPTAGGDDADDEDGGALLDWEDVQHGQHGRAEDEDDANDAEGDTVDGRGKGGAAFLTPLRLEVPPPRLSSPSSFTPPGAAERGDSSVSDFSSSRHSESHPFDQDVHHLENNQMHLLHNQQQSTPTAATAAAAALAAAHTAQPQLTLHPAAAAHPSPFSPSSSSPASLAAPAAAAGGLSGSDGVHLGVPSGAVLRKSASIGEQLAGRAREIAVREGRRLDALVRGLEEEGVVDYVEDHILETLDYDAHEDTMAELAIDKGGALHSHYLLLLKLIMMVLIGFVTAMLMYGVSQGVQLLYGGKVSATTRLIEQGQGAAAYFAFLFINLAITGVASSLVAIVAPHARGGGVPYALSYLNGTNVADYFSPRIVLVKAAALIFTIAGGLTLGMEGPFVFIGGGVALLCSNLVDRLFPFFFISFQPGGPGRRLRATSASASPFSRVIRNIREERIFMAGGLAAGLAVAFDAPIAGVLFALEGSTTFLTVPVVLRIFGCAMFASFFNDLGHNNFNAQVINHNLISPTESGSDPAPWAFSIPELLPFTILGLMGGAAGAFATWLNIRMTQFRHHHLEGKGWRDIGLQVSEVALFTLVTSTVWFVLPYLFGCREASLQCVQTVEGGAERCPQLQCSAGSYSEIGAFVYSSSDEVARLLFDRSLTYSEDYHVAPLIVYGAAYLLLVSTIYGAFVPGGLFVPSIVVGGMYGRVVGIFVEYLFPDSYINPGVYALLGAASMLGGFTRLALPVVLMLIELTGDATYLLPIMYCAMVGKFSADALYPPLYPQHMAIEKIPTLTDNLNPVVARLHAAELMIRKERLACIGVVERLSVIKQRLLQSKRVIFPLLTPAGQLVGCISRRSIMRAVNDSRSFATYTEALLQDERPAHAQQPAHTAAADDWHQSTVTHNAAVLSSSTFTRFEEHWLNLRRFCDQGVITAHPTTPAKRLQMLFRRLGISHLCVTDKRHHFLGFVTRRCLIYPPASAAAPLPTSHSAQHSTGSSSTDAAANAAPQSASCSSLAGPSHSAREQQQGDGQLSKEEKKRSAHDQGGEEEDVDGMLVEEKAYEEHELDEDDGDSDGDDAERDQSVAMPNTGGAHLSFAAQHALFAPARSR